MNEVQDIIKDNSLELNIGDVMLVYTDGITEALKKGSCQEEDVNKNMFGSEKLKRIFAGSGRSSPDTVKDSTIEELEEYECDDDVTLVVLKRVE